MKAAIYARVSKEIEDKDNIRYQEPSNQVEPLKQFIESQGWELKDENIFIDRKSGADSNRPEFKRMLAEARQHHFDILLVWSLDRFSREPVLNSLHYLQQLKNHGVHLKSMSDAIDTRELADTQELILLILLWQAQNERAKISKRTKAGIQRRKNLGNYKGGRPGKGG